LPASVSYTPNTKWETRPPKGLQRTCFWCFHFKGHTPLIAPDNGDQSKHSSALFIGDWPDSPEISINNFQLFVDWTPKTVSGRNQRQAMKRGLRLGKHVYYLPYSHICFLRTTKNKQALWLTCDKNVKWIGARRVGEFHFWVSNGLFPSCSFVCRPFRMPMTQQ